LLHELTHRMKSGVRSAVAVALLLAFVLCSMPSAFAQTNTGTIQGTITGQANTKLAGVQVTAVAPSGRSSATTDSTGFFNMQGIPLFLGRDFVSEEGQVGKDHVLIMTNRLWRERFGSDAHIIGQQLRLNREPFTVVGVLAAGMPDRFESHLFVPLAFKPEQITHDMHWLTVMGRLKSGVTLQQANADMDGITRRIAETYPVSNKGWGASVEPLKNNFTSRDTIKNLWLLMGAVGFVLLIACVNVANLLLARGTIRQKEVAVRSSLGATRSQLFLQFLSESLALSFIGGAIGVSLAWAMLKLIVVLLPPYSVPTEADIRLNLPVLFFSLMATVLAGVLCGCAPAWQTSRWNLSDTLKEGGRTASTAGRHGLRRILVVIEFADYETALACYHSPEYQKALPIRLANSKARAFIVEGA